MNKHQFIKPLLCISILFLSSCITKQIDKPIHKKYELSNYSKTKLSEIKKVSDEGQLAMYKMLSSTIITLDESMHNSFNNNCQKDISNLCLNDNIIDCLHKNRGSITSKQCSYKIDQAFGPAPTKSPSKFYNLTIPTGSIVYKNINGKPKHIKLSKDIIYNAIVFSKKRRIYIRDMSGNNQFIDNPFIIEKGLATSKFYRNGKEYFSPKKMLSFDINGNIKKKD